MAYMKIVIKVSMKDGRSRQQALTVVVSFIGVDKVALVGADKDMVEVHGEGIDAVEITKKLRKKLGSSDIVTVDIVEPGKKEEKKEEKKVEIKKEVEKPFDYAKMADLEARFAPYPYYTVPNYYQPPPPPRPPPEELSRIFN